MKSLLWMAALLLLSATTCQKENRQLAAKDYLIFGHFYGECVGEKCIELFKLESDQLLEDIKDQYPAKTAFYNGHYMALPSHKFQAVKDLLTYFPEHLWLEPNTVIGQPDAGDWGGIYLEYSRNGQRKFWLLDQKKSHVPEKYHQFLDKVNEKIRLLQ